jgi:TolA-binding protein
MAALRAGQTLSPSDVEVLSLHSTRWKDSASRIKSLEQNNQDLARTVNSLKAQLAELSRTVEVLNTQIANHLMGTPVPQTGKHLEDKDATITRLRHSDRAKGRVTSKWLSVKAAFGSAKQEAKGQATPTRPPMRDAATQTWPWHPIGQVAATQTDLPVPIIAGPTSGGASHASVTGPLRVLEVSMPPDDYD